MIDKLILAPHCDDEALGCGGLLAKHPQECVVVVATTPDDQRCEEFELARQVLGYTHTHWLHMKDGYLNADMAGLVRALDEVCAAYRPQELYLPYPSMHQDHIALYEAGVRSARLSLSPNHWFPPTVFVYDVAAYDIDLYPTDLKWNHFEGLSEEQAEKKATAIKAYTSQAVDGPHPINGITEGAKTCGQARKLEFAEPYAIVRQVRA